MDQEVLRVEATMSIWASCLRRSRDFSSGARCGLLRIWSKTVWLDDSSLARGRAMTALAWSPRMRRTVTNLVIFELTKKRLRSHGGG